MIYTGDAIDPGTETPDLNLIEPGVLPPGMPIPLPTMPAINPIRSVMYAGMGISAISSLVNGFSQAATAKAQGEYEASIANTNATIARIQEKQALEVGDVEAARENLKTQQIVGHELAMQGASGVDVSSGSSALTRISTSGVGAIDELTIRNNAQRRAWGYETSAIESTFQGRFAQLTAKATATQSLLTGGLRAIEGPLSIYARYKYMQRWMGVGGSPEVNAANTTPPFPNMS